MNEQTEIYKQSEGGGKEPRRDGGGRGKTVLIMAALVAGFIGLMWLVFREQLTPSVRVQAEPVVLLEEHFEEGATSFAKSELMFQASGWTEADPWPVSVAVLTPGFVESITVREGEAVTEGQVLAKLDPADAQLEQRKARAAEEAAKAALKIAEDSWKRIQSLSEQDTSEIERVQAKSELDLKIAELDAARVKREMADLALERTIIRSPMDGVVLRRYVQPGSKRSPAVDDPNSAVIVSLFDPEKLQVRVDVPIAEAGRLSIGQPVRVSTALLSGKVINGKVTRIVGEADIQRNTLQAKIALSNPDRRLRPEVLCRAEFWSLTTASATGESQVSGRHALWIPEAALSDQAGGDQEVWVVNTLTSSAELRAVKLGQEQRDGYRRVIEGLRANELVVTGGADDLKEGRRVSLAKAKEARQ